MPAVKPSSVHVDLALSILDAEEDLDDKDDVGSPSYLEQGPLNLMVPKSPDNFRFAEA